MALISEMSEGVSDLLKCGCQVTFKPLGLFLYCFLFFFYGCFYSFPFCLDVRSEGVEPLDCFTFFSIESRLCLALLMLKLDRKGLQFPIHGIQGRNDFLIGFIEPGINFLFKCLDSSLDLLFLLFV